MSPITSHHTTKRDPAPYARGQFCDYCTTADPTKSHPVTNAIDGTEKWWQSPPLSRGTGYNQVNVTLDLGQLFHVAYILIKFANSPRPDLWVLERSVDNGRTFSPWQYFAHSKRECTERFGKQPNARIINDDDQLCTTEYSRILPFENGEIVVSLVNGRPGSKNFTYSPVLQDFTQATNIRLHFLRSNTLLGHLISKAQRDPTVTRRYYYSIKDITVGGRCVCHGHAQVCVKGRDQDNHSRLQCECQHNTCGESCDRCCPGYNQRPWRAATVDSPNECQPCQCFSHALDCYYDPEVERKGASLDTFGRYNGGGVCISCQHNTAGVNCDQCTEGFYRPYGVSPESPAGCIPCICDYRGTVSAICDTYGRCLCRQGVEGQRCDRCRSKYHFFPSCEASILPCNATGTEASDPLTGFCRCRPNVEGPLCDKCKPLYWNLASDNPQGCSDCLCNLEGTLSGVGQCEQKSGQCYCKPRACGLTCDTCKDGYFLLQKKNYFGCQGCQCDIGGAIDFACDETSGQCQCRKNIVGRTCTKPAQGYYFPDLHQLKYEVEDGTTPNARPVRFGYNTQEFPDFSWRGYAVMSLSQSEVSVTVHVEPKNGRQLYRVLLRFINPRSTSVIATIHVTNIPGSTGLHQRKKIIFPRSLSPTFLTVPGDSFAEPFALNPGKWIIHIRAEGVLLDYLVLLPKDYYEAPLLQEKVTQPCTYLPTANKNTNCLLYKHLPLEGFSSTLGSEGTFYTRRRHRRRHADVRRPTPDHPDMAVLNERQSQLQLSLRVPRPGLYALIFEYASEMDTVQNINILNIFDTVNEESGGQIFLRANIYRCAYR
ncbi:laminin subunit alpha-3-like [Gouania willdenowi]|uniref:laminin subunit alpha-3-like n=1 Tax=Gouania willdenowi TaxID=441366 RepID=UPI00105572C7|nr:laminin subunit alpha-3-like [Gouania willdenowi]